ncbi:MAG TPA: rhomboid family intramembrane serine protease [Candidatus Macondimonas sp.]|nr:rhomboid family intramembrane serine protease [Candidatus Macondimonas sp.]
MVRTLIAINLIVYALQGMDPVYWISHFALWPVGSGPIETGAGWAMAPEFRPWQLVSYGFLHGNLSHLALNLFALWMFGSTVERFWGTARFTVYYLVCLIGAALIQMMAMAMHLQGGGQPFPTLGASGAVFGLLLAFGMMFPNQRILLLFPPIPIKAKWLVIGYGALELFFGLAGIATNIAHFAHLGGMLFGFLLIQFWRSNAVYRG